MANTTRPTGATKQIPRSEWKSYLERFTREYLMKDPPETVTVEVLSPEVGDQYEARNERLLGLTYDPKGDEVEVLLGDVDHLVVRPVEIWAIETNEGFLSTMELVRADGTKEILHIHRGDTTPSLHDSVSPSHVGHG